MNTALKTVAAAALLTSFATAAQAQTMIYPRENIVDMLQDRLPEGAEIVVSTSDTAVPEDDRLVMFRTPALTSSMTTCVNDRSMMIDNTLGVGLSYQDLATQADGQGNITVNMGVLEQVFREAARSFETGPEDPDSEYSELGQVYDYRFTKMANEYEEQTGITPVVITAIYEDPNSTCGVGTMEELWDQYSPELQQQLREQGLGPKP